MTHPLSILLTHPDSVNVDATTVTVPRETLGFYASHETATDVFQGVEVSMVSRGDSTLRGHFPSDLVSLEAGMDQGGRSASRKMGLA